MINAILAVTLLFGLPDPPVPMTPRPDLLVQSYDCSPRRTCKQIGSCDEARWYLDNCPWGGKLDRDNDGIPCESLC